jgi:hypothetical protein
VTDLLFCTVFVELCPEDVEEFVLSLPPVDLVEDWPVVFDVLVLSLPP